MVVKVNRLPKSCFQGNRGINALMVSEHFRQVFAHSLKLSPFNSSHNSAHSSQMPIHSKAYLVAFTDRLFNAWKVLIQIRAHSSTIFVIFWEMDLCTCVIFTSKSSQLIHASKQAFVWWLVTIILNFLSSFMNIFYILHEFGNIWIVINTIGID
jgi:hypothetical protein